MSILLDSNSIGIYFGSFELTAEGTLIDGGINVSYTTDNASVIDAEVPTPAFAHLWKWTGTAWECIDQPTLDAYLAGQKASYNESQKKNRYDAYTAESDPLFFKAQRGQATQQQWLDAIAAIDARFPYQV